MIRCGGYDVIDGSIRMPSLGAWFAPLRLDTATAPSGSVKIVADGGFTLTGFVAVAGIHHDIAYVNIVGGAGGLGKIMTPRAYQNAQLRDPLQAIMSMSGESLSSTVASSVLAVQLPAWTIVAETAAHALDALCGAAGTGTTWRVLEDGTIWMGVDTYPSKDLPAGSDLLDAFPNEGRYTIGCDAPWLLPGVTIAEVGKVAAVDHWIAAHELRTWAWL